MTKKERGGEYNRKYYKKNKEYIRERQRKWREENREYNKKYRERNKEYFSEYMRKHRYENREYYREYSRKWYLKNKEYNKECNRKWRFENPEYYRKYINNRRKTDIQFKLAMYLRARLDIALKRNYKVGSAVRDLGCSIEYFKKFLEQQFTEGMSWDNWGEWHIDHKIPLSAIDLTDRKNLKFVCHYTNLQPMWMSENIRKKDRLLEYN